MLFKQSAVKGLTRDTVVEEAGRMPQDIYPAMIGSGRTGLGLDATGMQGLNARTRQYRDTMSLVYDRTSTQDDLYIRHDGAVSKHEVLNDSLWNPETNHMLMPCGWLDYEVEIDGDSYDTRRIAAEAADWRREFSPLTGIVETSFRLGPIRIGWKAGVAPGRDEVEFLFEAVGLDGRTRTVALCVRCRQTTRAGRPLATGGVESSCADGIAFRVWRASTETSTAPVLEPVAVSWALAFHSHARYETDEGFIAARFEGGGERVRAGLRLVAGCDRDGTHTREHALQRADAYRAAAPEAALEDVAGGWRAFFEGAADVRLGDPAKEFLVLQGQYLMRAGCGWRSGIPVSTLWTQAITPATYWDGFFTAEGMLRCGHVGLVRDLCSWLMRTARAEGRPHYWMTYCNGVPVETYDKAYHVILAFAGIFIRLYECSRDRGDLERLAYPYLRRVAEFAFAEVLAEDSAGWHLHGGVEHDVDAASANGEKNAGILLWMVVCVAKCAEYAAELGVDDELVAKCRRVDEHFRASPIDLADPGMWAMWLPFLTAAGPLADFESWRRMARQELADTRTKLYIMQPWVNFVVATSLSMTGEPDLALEVQNDGLNSISGLGCIDEVTYESHGGGWAPFPTCTGSWLSSVMIGFAHGGLWDDDVLVCVHLPKRLAHQYLSWRGVTTLNGARVSGSYDPHRLEAVIESPAPRRARLRVPARIAGEPLAVRLDGEPVAFEGDGETATVDLPAGEHRVSIERDLAAEADVIVAEPFDHGRELVGLIAGTGRAVRWLRDFETLKDLAGRTRVVAVHPSYVALPVDVVGALEDAVARGLAVIGLFHAGCVNVDRAMAELTGVRATFDGTEREYWQNRSVERTWRLTERGREVLPSLAPEMKLPVCARFVPRPAEGVEILAVDAADGRPVVTARRLGAGQVFWIASGGKTMDFGDIGRIHSAGKKLWLFGEDPQDLADLKWLRSPDWGLLLLAVLNAAL